MNSTTKAELIAAMDYATSADSQNARKGQAIRTWFQTTFGLDAAVSVVNEERQIGNRVVEQFKHHRPVVLFICKEVDFVDHVVRDVQEKAYPELRIAFCFVTEGPSRYVLRSVVNVTGDHVRDEMLQAFPANQVIEKSPPPKPLDSSSVSFMIDWSIGLGDAPCGLVGLALPFHQALAALSTGKHVIFIGAPGTGKTELAKCICRSLGVPFTTATATSEWTTSDTIGGYFPIADSDGGVLGALDFRPGVISRAIEDDEWLIIDEINRADIDKAFGELFSALSGTTVRLPFQKRTDEGLLDVVVGLESDIVESGVYPIAISKNWRLIGTMNSFDKASLYQLSFAFMRRFAFIPVEPPTVGDFRRMLEDAANTIEATLDVPQGRPEGKVGAAAPPAEATR